jgi:uncharacterized repeat protein (TIGR03803 family)
MTTLHDINHGLSARFIGANLCCALLATCGGGDGSNQPLTAEDLYCFGSSSTDAMGPNGALIQASDGNFYGTTTGGGIGGGPPNDVGIYPGNGAVFKITPTGEETVLHLFAGSPADGQFPSSLIQGSDGNFYGTTYAGGTKGSGTVFKLTPEGVETILYSTGSEGVPVALVQRSDGNLYVAADIMFKLTPAGVVTPVASLPYAPTTVLIQGSDGNIYGTSYANSGVGYGDTVFKVTPEGGPVGGYYQGTMTLLHTFSGPPADGDTAFALVQGSDGDLYGTTLGGGAAKCSCGTAFKLLPEGAETILHSFSGQSDGASPYAGLVQGTDGNFYGTTFDSIFQLTPAGVVTQLHSFSESGDFHAQSQLVQGSDGNLYGTTYEGGPGATHAGCFYRFVLGAH